MNTRSRQLIQNYLLASATQEEVSELEGLLKSDIELQHEFLLQAEIDAHLRQEAQSVRDIDQSNSQPIDYVASHPHTYVYWKWISSFSSLAAAILLALLLSDLPPARPTMVFPSLGKLLTSVSWNKTNIWQAAQTGDLQMLGDELKPGISVDARTREGYTPLHIATVFGQSAAVDFLLSRNADVNLADNEGNTALHMAVFLGYEDVVSALLKYGADPHARNAAGYSSIDCAGAPWSQEYEAHLREAEAEMNTPLDMNRIRGQRLTILKLLVGSDIGNVQTAESTRLLNAAITGDVSEIRECLVGTDLNATEPVGGSTALMLAAVFGKREAFNQDWED